MMRTYLAIAAASATLAASPGLAQDESSGSVSVETYGYLRAGVGLRSGGGAQTCFGLPAAGGKYRLGNECEAYFEPGVKLSFGARGGLTVSLNLTASLLARPLNDFDNVDIFGEEAWVGVTGFATEGAFSGAQVWAGHRFYKRQGVGFNDFDYWDASGLGLGIADLDLGFGKGSVAYFADSAGDIETALDGTPYERIDLRVEEIALGRGTLMAGIDFRFGDGPGLANDGGGMATVQYDREDRHGGALTLALQGGWGAGASLNYASNAAAPDDARALRGIARYLWNRDSEFAVVGTAIAEYQSDGANWYSIGARPVWHLNRDFYLALEAGIDHVEPQAGPAQTLGKLTAALEWKPTGSGLYARPALRIFATTAHWNDAARAAGVGTAFSDNSGATAGIQIVHSW